MKLTEQQGHMLLGASPALVLGLGIGASLSFFITKKRIENKYLEISNKEIAEAKQFYSILNKKNEFETPESTVESLGLVTEAVDALQTYQGGVLETDKPVRVIEKVIIESVSIDAVPAPHHETIEIVDHNIFSDNEPVDSDSFDYEEELKHRGEIDPFIVSHDEFMEAESGNSQITLTYYEGDGVLTDEADKPIPDVDETVGEDNLQRFGYGSKDSKIVYIRNPRLDIDFEVVQSQGKYTEEVLGFLEHSDRRPRIRKFRGDDE